MAQEQSTGGTDRATILAAAVQELTGAGVAVIPVRPREKRPLIDWKSLQGRLPGEHELGTWFNADALSGPFPAGVGAVMGRISGAIEMTELEGRAMKRWPEVKSALIDSGLEPVLRRLESGWTEVSPSGGMHFFYSLTLPDGEPFPGNRKIAQRPAGEDENGRPVVDVLAETRGEGGFVVMAPTDGSHHDTRRGWARISGGPGDRATLTLGERDALHAVLRDVLDEMPEAPVRTAPRTDATARTDAYGTGLSPLEDFNDRTDWADILEPEGWTYAYTDRDGTRYWWRPGKDRGQISASTDRPTEDGASRLYIWSTSQSLPTEEPLTKGFVAAHYRAGGNMSAFSSSLRKDGYGDALERPQTFTDPELDALGRVGSHDSTRTLDELGALSSLDAQLPDRAAERLVSERMSADYDRDTDPRTPGETSDRTAALEASSASLPASDPSDGGLDLSGLPEATEATDSASQGDETDPPPSWGRLDLSAVLDGTWASPEATLMAREDGACLLYPGMVHSFQGESESGKSFLAQAETARVLTEGGRVLYLDFESDQGTVVSRMLALGAPVDAIRDRLDYRRPEASPIVNGAETAAWLEMLATPTDLAIIDGVTEAFAVFGVSSVDNDDVTAWGRNVPRKIAVKTGAAVVVIDHVTKATEGRGRFAIGAQAKMSYLTGASYTVEVKAPLGVGMVGVLSLRVGKDRPGRVRPVSGEYRASDRSQEAAQAVIDSTEPGTTFYELRRPETTVDPSGIGGEDGEEFVPTGLMEKVSRVLEDEPRGTKALRQAVAGKAEYVSEAIRRLEREQYIRRSGERSPWELVKPYRETEDPRSGKTTPSLDLEGLPGGLRDSGSNANGRP